MSIISTKVRNAIALIGLYTAVCLLAACVTTGHSSLRESAARLDDASNHFSVQLQYHGDDSRRGRLSRDAEAMAASAHKLDRALSSGATRSEVEGEYRRVTDNYERLHEQLADEGYAEQNRQVLADFDRVTTAYRDVETAMGLRAVSSR